MSHEHIVACLPEGKGFFVIVEGLDGSGKTTAVQTLKDLLNARIAELTGEAGDFVLTTREPGGTPFAERCRQFFFDNAKDISSTAQTFLINAARADHVEKVIKPALDAGKIVICDRFNFSTYLYQTGLQPDDHMVLESYSVGELIPDLALLFQVTPENSIARVQGREQNNFFDEQAKAKIIERAERFNELAGMIANGELPLAANVVAVDANRDLGAVNFDLSVIADQLATVVKDYRAEAGTEIPE